MIMNTVNHTSEYGYSFGYQLLGVFLFFIPRSIWTSKPFGSGYTVRLYQGEKFLNVSSPFIAEGLMNFGMVGVLIMGLVVGRIVKRLDTLYWLRGSSIKNIDNNYIGILYPFLLSLFFFMNRGDLMSTFSFLTSHVVVYTLLFYINNKIFFK